MRRHAVFLIWVGRKLNELHADRNGNGALPEDLWVDGVVVHAMAILGA